MKQLLTIYDYDVDSEAPAHSDTAAYNERSASRAITISDKGEIHLLNVTLHKYHKLPGGGIDEGEDKVQALKRELLEEIGCRADIIMDVGIIIEYRDFQKLKQISFCYIAKQRGSQVKPALEEGEIAEGMQQTLALNIDAAIALVEKDKPDNLEGSFIKARDLTFLKAAKELMASDPISRVSCR